MHGIRWMYKNYALHLSCCLNSAWIVCVPSVWGVKNSCCTTWCFSVGLIESKFCFKNILMKFTIPCDTYGGICYLSSCVFYYHTTFKIKF